MASLIHLALLMTLTFLAVLNVGEVTSFSIRHRADKSTSLADALTIVQRRRRRVNDADFIPRSNVLLGDDPLTLQDLSEWLSSGANERDEHMKDTPSSWLSSIDDFESPDDQQEEFIPLSPIIASPREIEAIFEKEADDNARREKKQGNLFSKKKKEEMINVKGDKTVIHKTPEKPKAKRIRPSDEQQRLLNSLTKNEMKVLMKAVSKLQQLDDVDDEDEIEEDISEAESSPEEAIVVSEPVSKEELESVFQETDEPLIKETKIIEEKGPKDEEPILVEEQIISETPDIDGDAETEAEQRLAKDLKDEIVSELRDDDRVSDEVQEAVAEVAASIEEDVRQTENNKEQLPLSLDSQKLAAKYWLLNEPYYTQPDKNIKRTSKRASGQFQVGNIKAGLTSDVFGDINSRERSRHGSPSSGSRTGDFENISGKEQQLLLSLVNMPLDKSKATINLSWLSPQLQAFVVKIISLQDEVDKLKIEAQLEDMENDALTDALNEATLSQKEGTVSNVEWTSLQNAIQLEAALQDIKHSKEIRESSYFDAERNSEPDGFRRVQNSPKKRERIVMEDEDDEDKKRGRGNNFNFPVGSYRGEDEDVQKQAVERLLEESYFLRDRTNDLDEDEEIDEDNDEIASLFLRSPERCSAVRKYSTNCALADAYSLPVDFEARALCNLHEMCYACGTSLGVEQSECDTVYRAAVSSLCKGKDQCEAEAEIFLRAIKLRVRFISYEQPSCRSSCTAKFLGMF